MTKTAQSDRYVTAQPPSPAAAATAEDGESPEPWPMSSSAVPFLARTHCTAVLADESVPSAAVAETCPKMVTTGHTFSLASACAVLLSALVGSLP